MTVNPALSAGLLPHRAPGRAAHHLPEVPVRRVPQAPRRDRVRRLDVQEQVRERADHASWPGALGMADAENKLSVGYGAEAGEMAPSLRRFVEKHCKNSFVMCRNEPSRKRARRARHPQRRRRRHRLDVRARAPVARAPSSCASRAGTARRRCSRSCPINPFWWPVKPDLLKTAAMHAVRPVQARALQERLLPQRPRARSTRSSTPTAAASPRRQRLPQGAARVPDPGGHGAARPPRLRRDRVAPRRARAACSSATSTTCTTWSACCGNCTLMVTSRFHAIVTSMPGLVSSGGITMDERIRNVMAIARPRGPVPRGRRPRARGAHAAAAAQARPGGRRASAATSRAPCPDSCKLMGQMGIDFVDEVSARVPRLSQARLAAHLGARTCRRLPARAAPIMEKHA